VIEALVGAAVGVLTIATARLIRGERWLYALGLPVLPGLYALFALQAGEQAVALREMVYGAPFVVAGLVFAFVSVRRSAAIVGAFPMRISAARNPERRFACAVRADGYASGRGSGIISGIFFHARMSWMQT
jgi:hypothetical protein